MDISEIRRELSNLPKKSLGQNFLLDESVVVEMVENANIIKDDTIFEIGPGLGILTQKLLASPAGKIILCEKDDELCRRAKEKYSSGRTKVICQDALVLIPSLVVSKPFKVIANLPYNISSPVIFSLLTAGPTVPDQIIVMLQEEVAERLTSKPGDSNRGLLTVLIELYGKARIIKRVGRGSFYPSPRVDSAIISIESIKDPGFETKSLRRMLKFAFSGKRKKLKNSLFSTLKIDLAKQGEISERTKIDLNKRPEDLTASEWISLARELEDFIK